MHRLAMLESDAWRALTLAARLVLERLEIEHMRHHGKRNGHLIVTYDEFLVHMGRKRRHAVAAAIDQLERSSLLVVEERGKWNDGRDRRASRYRLTYLPTADGKTPTDEWRSSVTKTSLRDGDENVTTVFEIGDENVTTESVTKTSLHLPSIRKGSSPKGAPPNGVKILKRGS